MALSRRDRGKAVRAIVRKRLGDAEHRDTIAGLREKMTDEEWRGVRAEGRSTALEKMSEEG